MAIPTVVNRVPSARDSKLRVQTFQRSYTPTEIDAMADGDVMFRGEFATGTGVWGINFGTYATVGSTNAASEKFETASVVMTIDAGFTSDTTYYLDDSNDMASGFYRSAAAGSPWFSAVAGLDGTRAAPYMIDNTSATEYFLLSLNTAPTGTTSTVDITAWCNVFYFWA